MKKLNKYAVSTIEYSQSVSGHVSSHAGQSIFADMSRTYPCKRGDQAWNIWEFLTRVIVGFGICFVLVFWHHATLGMGSCPFTCGPISFGSLPHQHQLTQIAKQIFEEGRAYAAIFLNISMSQSVAGCLLTAWVIRIS